MTEVPAHPAKFSDPILAVLADLADLDVEGPILDPFAGVGRIFEVYPEAVGLEIERDWAAAHPRIIAGNALHPPFRPHAFRSIVTSCTYGNRMADNHDAQERCRECKGEGTVQISGVNGIVACGKCEGKGHREYVRMTYRHKIGHALHPDNSGGLQWGPKYRAFHLLAWGLLLTDAPEEDRYGLLAPGGRFVLNVKNHVRDHVEQPVVEWHLATLLGLGLTLDRIIPVECPGMGHGQNRDARADFEFVLVFHRG